MGSDRLEDARALLALVRPGSRRTASRWVRAGCAGRWSGWSGRGRRSCRARPGRVRILLGQEAPEAFGERLGSWVDAPAAPGAEAALAGRLPEAGDAGPLLESAPAVCGGCWTGSGPWTMRSF